MSDFEALLIVSFGGPEKREDVIPFLENVLRGRSVPKERVLDVAEHYYHFEGRSPINDQNRELIEALRPLIGIPIYWGNRNWHPFLIDTLREMQRDGVRRAIALATSAFGSYSGCRQYLENIRNAQDTLAETSEQPVPEIYKIRPFGLDPLFIDAMSDRVRDAFRELPNASLVFTAHSVPALMAQTSPYVRELEEASRRVAQQVGAKQWKLVYQSRSGAPGQPWLEPDVCDYLRELRSDVVIAPIGFLSDHMEVMYDLDVEARAVCDEIGVQMRRAKTVGTHPSFIKLIADRVKQDPGACPDVCCPAPQRPSVRS